MNKVLACMLGVLGLAACATTNDPLRLYQRNSGDIINLRVGEVVEVVLEGNPGTDIHWITPPEEIEILEQVGSTRYEADLQSHEAERRLITRFRAVAAGRTRLQLAYRDPAESGRDTTFEVWVVVSERS